MVKTKCKFCGIVIRDVTKQHCPMCDKKFRAERIKPKTKFYTKRGR